MTEELRKQVEGIRDTLVADRRTLHSMPEVGMDLPQTAAYVARRLTEMGYSPTVLGACGVTATAGTGGPCLLLRADMDALPVPEENDLPFRAENGNMHACGHDLHTAILLGAAKLLKEREGELNGTVKFMFQPGEEYGMGAKDMVEHGILEDPKVDAAFALHVQPAMEIGSMGYHVGVATSSIHSFFIDIQGKGGHSSQPENTVNPLAVAARLYMELDSLVQREVGASGVAVLAVCEIHGGTQANIIPDTARVTGSLRCFDREVQTKLIERIREIVSHTAAGCRATADIQLLGTPFVTVDAAMAETLKPVFKAVYGPDGVEKIEKPFSGSEDFSYVTERVPGVFCWIGAGEPGSAPLHNPKVMFREEAMERGVELMVGAALRWLDSAK